jgi:phenylpyruvate tautomerase PptA (4-oxalocrotonate tautomerase family)
MIKELELMKKFTASSRTFAGGAETSYLILIRKIENDPRMSKAKKKELIEDVSHLAAHTLNDIYTQENWKYDGAYYSGIKYLNFDCYDRPSKWQMFLSGDAFRSIYASSKLETMRNISNLIGRMKKMIMIMEENENGNEDRS